MAIKFYNPTTPGRRDMSTIDYSGLSKVAPERSLLEPMKKHSGRNSYGRSSSWRRQQNQISYYRL